MKKILLLFILSTLVFADTTAPASNPTITKIKEEVIKLFELSKKVNDKNSKDKQAARNAIDAALDWDLIAKDCLGEIWSKQSEGNRKEFRNLLKEVIVRTAYTRLDKFWQKGITYQVENVTLKDKIATVPAKFQIKDKSDVQIEYALMQKDGKWLISDISYEGEHYSKNIREQIEAFLSEKKTFQSLLDKLKKRRQDLIEEANKSEKKKG